VIGKHAFPSVLLAFVLFACSSGDEQKVAGGDDMGNFLQAQLADSNGAPLEGRITAYSDVDSISTELDAGGLLVLPSRHRSWIALQTPQGAKFLLHAPSAFGRLGTFRLGSARPLVGWLKRIATIRIAGVGSIQCTGGLFRFAAVPPGLMRLEAFSDSFSASTALSTAFGTMILDAATVDSFITPPLSVSSSELVVSARDDTSSCGATCPQWLWTHANVIGNTPTASRDTFLLTYPDSRLAPDTSAVVAIDSILNTGNWLLLRFSLRGIQATPLIWIDSSKAIGRSHALLVGAGPTVDTASYDSSDSIHSYSFAIPRTTGSLMADSLSVGPYGALGRSIDPSSASIPSDTCKASFAGSQQLCDFSGTTWILSR